MGGAAAAMAAFSGQPRSYMTASERPARRRASLRGQAAPAPGARMSADIGAKFSKRGGNAVIVGTLDPVAATSVDVRIIGANALAPAYWYPASGS